MLFRSEDALPVPKAEYAVWCLKNCKYGSPVKRMVKNHPEVVRQLISSVSSEEYQHLLAMAKDMNPMLYRELNSAGSGEFREKLAKELTARYQKGQPQAIQYLLGDAELQDLYPYVNEWRGGYDYDTKKYQKIHAMKKNGLDMQMYRRAVVLEALCMRPRYFNNYWYDTYKKIDRQTIREFIELFEEEQLPVSRQLEALSSIHDSYYSEQAKTDFINECTMAIRLKKDQWGADLAVQAREGIAVVRFLCIRVLDEYGQEYKEVLLSCALDRSRQVRERLAAVYEGHRDWEPEILQMLGSRKSQDREMAVLVLKHWGADAYRTSFEAALEKEKSKKIRELLEKCLGMESRDRKSVV